MKTIHPTAIVHPDAVIADGVDIGPYAIVEAGVEIGEGTRIESANRICSGARIGARCRIMHGAAVATAPQEDTDAAVATAPQEDTDAAGASLAVIGDDTVIREFAAVSRGSVATGRTIVGSNCMIMAYCHIAHDASVADGVVMANGVQVGSGAAIDRFAIIGGMTGIADGARVGPYCMVSGSAYVTHDVPPFSLAGREPIVFEGLNAIGLRRRKFSPDTIQAIDAAYGLFYGGGISPEEAVERMKADWPDIPEIGMIAAFVASSRLGLIPREQG